MSDETEWVLVKRDDLLRWAEDFARDNDPGDDTDVVAPFDDYLLRPPAEAQPVAWQFQDREGNWHGFVNEKHRLNTIEDGSWPIRALYDHPPPSAPVGVEGFEQWYARVDARFWNNWDACNAAFHAGKRSALAQQPAAVDEVISAAREVAKEHDGPLETIVYDSDDDEAGDRVCCRVRSYEPHAEGCPLIRLRAALAAQQGGAK